MNLYSNVNFNLESGSKNSDPLGNISCGGVTLEPRLQEYIKKKKFYKTNNIDPTIPLEKEFMITGQDKEHIKSFLRGRKDIYNHPVKMDNDHKRVYFPSKGQRDDPRVPKLKDQKQVLPKNMGMFVPDKKGDPMYDKSTLRELDKVLDGRDLESHDNSVNRYRPKLSNNSDKNDGWDPNYQRFNPRGDLLIDNPDYERKNKYKSQYRINDDPRNKYIISNLLEDCEEQKRLIGTTSGAPINTGSGNKNNNRMKDYTLLDEHTNKQLQKMTRDDNTQGSNMSMMDVDNKVNIPQMGCRRNSNLTESNMGQIGDVRMLNYDVETEMIRGMRSTGQRSYGYRNPQEHYFHYLEDPDEFKYNGVDEGWIRGGESTRLENKKLAKQKYKPLNC